MDPYLFKTERSTHQSLMLVAMTDVQMLSEKALTGIEAASTPQHELSPHACDLD
jgi:hypothetical protein